MKKLILGIVFIAAIATLQSFQIPSPVNKPASITCLGIKEAGIVFELKIENETGKRTEFVIRDKNGESLYEETFKEKVLVKRFLLPADGNDEFLFVVRHGANKYEKRFVINREEITTVRVDEVK